MLHNIMKYISQTTLLFFIAASAYATSTVSTSSANQASPVIHQFDSQITVQTDGTLLVTETLQMTTDGKTIQHGIYRDLPMQSSSDASAAAPVSFTAMRATLDNNPVAFHTKSNPTKIRIYLGRADTNLPPGEHTYTLSYSTTNQLKFFSDHDELYWNVTGNDWNYPIEQASATVHLPIINKQDLTGHTAYTGYHGSRDQDYTTSVNDQGITSFQTTKSLAPQQGLTIVVGWHKGFVTAPNTTQTVTAAGNYPRGMSLPDNHHTHEIMLYGIIGLLIYYFLVWSIYGRDAKKLAVMPQYTPPPDISPAGLRYILDMGYDTKVFAAAILTLAVKGYLQIIQTKKFLISHFTLLQNNNQASSLSPSEKVIVNDLFADGNKAEIQAQTLEGTVDNYKKALKTEFGKYFVTNAKFAHLGTFLSLALIFYLIPYNGVSSLAIYAMVLIVATLPFALIRKLTSLKNVLGFLVFSAVLVLAFHDFPLPLPSFYLSFSVLLALMQAGFSHLLKRETPAGAKVVAAAKGFKMFLEATEKDQMNFRNPPQKTPELFEKYLPYALALGVEQQWSERFAQQLDTGYQPTWYSGNVPFGSSNFSTAVTKPFTSALNSATNSSSGFSGSAGSGGGGGGGGGGGW